MTDTTGNATGRGTSREEDFNCGLADAMERVSDFPDVEFLGEKQGLLASSGKRVDVLIFGNYRKSAVAVECEYDIDPMLDAAARLGEKTRSGEIIRVAIGVRAPAESRQIEGTDRHADFLIDGKPILEYAAVVLAENGSREYWPQKGFIRGSVGALTEFACGYLTSKQELERQAEETANAVEEIARNLTASINDNADCYKRIRDITGREGRDEALRATGLVWLDAFLFQDRLAAQKHFLPDADNPEKPLREIVIPPRAAAYSGSEYPLLSQVLAAWQTILEINYGSIYSPASDLLTAVGDYVGNREVSQVLHIASEKAERVTASSLGVFDLSGELFQRLLLDRVAAAAYYTRPEVAEFLARMTATDEWLYSSAGLASEPTDPNERTEWVSQGRSAVRRKLENIRFGDFACGTGSLLRATYRKLRAVARDWQLNEDRAVNNKQPDEQWLDRFHKEIMQTQVAGFDISPIATHLTSSSLANLSPSVPYTKTNIGLLPVCTPTNLPAKRGGKSRPGDATTGALDFLATDEVGNLFSSGTKTAAGEDEIEKCVAADGEFDLVLMNPPYARGANTQKGDTETKRSPFFGFAGTPLKLQNAARKRAQALIKGSPCSLNAGLATVFSVLAEQKLRPGGRVGLVLPLTAATAASWCKTRAMFATEFEDLTVATYSAGSKGEDVSFSAETGMGELLLIATKKTETKGGGGQASKPSLTTINLFTPFISIEAASQIAAAITEKLADSKTQNSGIAYVGEMEVAEYATTEIDDPEDVWPFVAVSSLRLASVAERFANSGRLSSLTSDKIVGTTTSMKTVGEIFGLGQTDPQIGAHHWSKSNKGAFELHKVANKNDLRRPDLLLWGNDAKTQHAIRMAPTHYGLPYGTKAQCDMARGFATQLFYNIGVRWTSQRNLAATTEKPCLSGSAWFGLLHDDPVVRFGFAIYANSALGFLVGWSRGGKQQSGRTITRKTALAELPCPDFTDPNIHARAANLLATQPDLETLELLPAVRANIDENRHKLNEACCEMLGLPVDVLNDLADAWVEEPSVSG